MIRTLARLEALRWTFGAAVASERRTLLRRVLRARLDAAAVLRLHEVLLAAAAYPDDRATRALVTRALAGFGRRPDVRRHRAALADSGVAGCDIRFGFFAPTARRIAARWPRRLELDLEALAEPNAVEAWLPLLAHDAEVPGLDEYDYGLAGWLARLRGRNEATGTFFVRALSERLGNDDAVFERVHDGLDPAYVLHGDATTPSRTHARWPSRRVHFQSGPFGGRPELAGAANTPPRAIRVLSPREGEKALQLAMECMATRSRDLDVFAWGDARDVRQVDCGDGLEFLMIGALPERRLLLESVYGFLTLKNGMPIGYVLTSALYRSAEIAFNVFDTFRGAEAGPVYGKVLGMTRALFGVDAFTIFPYQLGEGNDEAIESGAWWFYEKMGFRPHATAARTLLRRERARMARDPRHRSSPAVLRRLAEHNLYAHMRSARRDVIGELPLPSAGLAVTRLVTRRFRGDRLAAGLACDRIAAERLRVNFSGWSSGERHAWSRWAPLVTLLPVGRWSARARADLVRVIRAKGGRREDAFVHAFDAHPRLGPALARLLRATRT